METTVEWLVKEINKLTGLTIQIDEPIIEQAKEMEKNRICNSYSQALIDLTLYENGQISDEEYLVSKQRAEQYYNETFKSE